jgi:rod shape-determining protein MreD
MTKVVLALAATYLALVFQTTVCPLIRLGGASPDLLALVALTIVLLSASPYAFLWAGWVGLLHDLASTGRIGVAMFWFAVAGYLITRFRDHVYAETLPARTLACVLGSFVAVAGLVATRRLLGDTGADWATCVSHSIRVAVYTGLVAVPLFVFVGRRVKGKAGDPAT